MASSCRRWPDHLYQRYVHAQPLTVHHHPPASSLVPAWMIQGASLAHWFRWGRLIIPEARFFEPHNRAALCSREETGVAAQPSGPDPGGISVGGAERRGHFG